MTRGRLIPYFAAVIAVFHAIGFYVFIQQPEWIALTPYTIILCAVLVFLSELRLKTALGILFFVGVGGFLAEWIGTSTGYLFGDYYYGETLGAQVLKVPLIIALNWYAIVLASASLFVTIKLPLWAKSFLSGLAAMLLDLVLEPVAIRFGFWFWNSDIPLYNYICWFFLASGFAWFYLKSNEKQNSTAFFLYFIWMVFFGALNLI